jgi:polyisoprenoid-binding protein YceI
MNRYSAGLWIALAMVLSGCASPAATSSVQEQPNQVPATDTAASQATATASNGGRTYSLDPSRTTATFIIHEVLLGKPNKVVGTSQSVQGSFAVDLNDPASAEFQPVVIDAQSFVTDEDRRNQAIRNFILETGKPENKTVTFQITSVDGLAASADVGQSYDVQITGDLTLHGITKPVTFSGQVKAASAGEIQGTLSATISRSDFSLIIPNVPFVADVDESFELLLTFAAQGG